MLLNKIVAQLFLFCLPITSFRSDIQRDHFVQQKLCLNNSKKNFVRPAYSCLFKQYFERKDFAAYNKNFQRTSKKQKTLGVRTFYVTCTLGLRDISLLKSFFHDENMKLLNFPVFIYSSLF